LTLIGVKENNMEQARLLLAIGLSFLVLFVWSMFFTDQQPVPQPDQENDQPQMAETPVPQPSIDQTAQTAVPIDQSEVGAIPTHQPPAQADRQITIDTPIYTARISTHGAAFTSFILKHYRETADVDSPNKELIPPDFKDGIIRTSLLNQSVSGLENAAIWATSTASPMNPR
jgi:YidC/Oxa1 family membrane protein insertase